MKWRHQNWTKSRETPILKKGDKSTGTRIIFRAAFRIFSQQKLGSKQKRGTGYQYCHCHSSIRTSKISGAMPLSPLNVALHFYHTISFVPFPRTKNLWLANQQNHTAVFSIRNSFWSRPWHWWIGFSSPTTHTVIPLTKRMHVLGQKKKQLSLKL